MSPSISHIDIESDHRRDESADQLLDEIARTEAAISEGERQIESMVRSATVELSCIFRVQANHSELKTYLKGLRFQAGIRQPRQ